MYLLTSLFVSVGLIAGAIAELTEEEEGMIDSFMEDLIECRGMPGAGLSLVREGEIELARGYGFANIENNEAFTAESRFAIASVTKSLTATLTAKLMPNSSIFDWNTFARDILGEDFHFIDGYRSNNTMLRDMVSHQTGIPRHDAVWALDAARSRQEIVMEKLRFMEELYPVRSDFLYNNNMYSIVGLVLETLFGASWEDLLSSEFFNPLGMDSSTFYDFAAPDYEGFVTPYGFYVASENPDELLPYPYILWSGSGLAGPAASVCSTATDMAKWMQFILNGGVSSDGIQIVDKDVLDRVWFPESAFDDFNQGKPYEPVTDSTSTYSLGYFDGHYRGYRSHSHGGDLTGFHSEVFFLPDMNVSSFFTTNFGGHTSERVYVHRFMMDVLLGFEPAYNASVVCEILGNLEIPQNSVHSKQLENTLPDEIVKALNGLGLKSHMLDMMNKFDEFDDFSMNKFESIILSQVKTILASQNNEASRLIGNYEGDYGNFAFGNVTVTESSECTDCLYMEYGNLGQFTLQPTNVSDVFIAYNAYPIYQLMPVSFSGEDDSGNATYVVLPQFNTYSPPVFERDLLMSEAPLPRNDLCEPVY